MPTEDQRNILLNIPERNTKEQKDYKPFLNLNVYQRVLRSHMVKLPDNLIRQLSDGHHLETWTVKDHQVDADEKGSSSIEA